MKITLEPGQNLYFTSDTHYNHTNICSGTTKWTGDIDRTTRKFATLPDMNAAMVVNLNTKVGENDILIHLGDWSFGGFESIQEFRNKVNCKNIHLTLGNHDHHIKRDKGGVKSLFSSVHTFLELEVVTKSMTHRFICMHYPIASWPEMNRGVIHLHGHVHLPHNLKIHNGKAMDIGVDGNGMHPYSLNEIVRIMEKQPVAHLILPKDHHTQEVR